MSKPTIPVAPQPPNSPPAIPQGARQQVAHYLGVVTATEEQLRDALVLVAERHERNYEIARGATVLAIWCAEALRRLEPLRARYGTLPSEAAELLRASLLSGTRVGVVGELNDISDLATLIQKAEMTWTILVQGGRELHDDTLIDVASKARDHSRRQLAWCLTMIEHEAPDAIAVVPDWSGQLAATMPKRPERDRLGSRPRLGSDRRGRLDPPRRADRRRRRQAVAPAQPRPIRRADRAQPGPSARTRLEHA